MKIQMPFPIYEGLEVKNATVDLEKGVSVVEYGEKNPEFNRGDIIATDSGCVIIFDKWSHDGKWYKHIYAGINESGIMKYADSTFGSLSVWRLATQSEQQLLFDTLAKEGKKWNADTLQIEDIEKEILVPESIGIYTLNGTFSNCGDSLGISFNDDKQLLVYNTKLNVYEVTARYDTDTKIQCKLTPSKREDLKAGDTGFCCGANKDFSDIMNYMKVLKDGAYDFVWIEEYTNIRLCTEFDDPDYSFFKVEPINK